MRPLRPCVWSAGRRATPLGLSGLALAVGMYAAEPAAIPVTAPAPGSELTLDDAIHLALERNQRIKVQSYTRSIARANLLTAEGHFDPALNFQRSYAEDVSPIASNPLVTQLIKTDTYTLTLDGIMPWGLSYSVGGNAQNNRGTFNAFNDNFSTFGGVTVTQPILRGLGFSANLVGVHLAKADRGISDWEYRQTVIDTVTSVIYGYNDLVLARENLRITRLSRGLAAQLLDENEKRFKVGYISEADVTQARARVASSEESILIAERAVHDSENRLRELIGEDHFQPDGPALPLAPLPPALEVKVSPAEDLQRALSELRPDYQEARLGLQKYRTNEALARNQLLPRVDFVGSYGYAGLDRDFAASRRQVSDRESRSYSAGVVVSLPLTFAEGRGRARAAHLGRLQAEADLKRLEQDIAVSVANAAGQIETTRRRVAANHVAYQLAQQALDAEVKRLRAGTSTTFVVLQLQENLAVVEGREVSALADQHRAIASYERETGLTLARHHITLEK